MKQLTRRVILAGGATASVLSAIPFSAWIKQQARAQGTFTRYNAYSSQGQAMLQIYKTAVGLMMNSIPEQNPLSWTFQWYTHWVMPTSLGSDGKTSELNRIYPLSNPPYFALAKQMWETCQAHAGENEDFFLPWHRMFVYYFEMIVRQVSGQPSFTLPYWNYSNPAQSAIPVEFQDPTSPLYRAHRNSGVNTGNQIPASVVALNAFNETVYSINGVAQGFCSTLDFGLHGNVHVWVGDSQGMGTVPWAANDPIFWLHHCNIDRLWESWNLHFCSNPSYPAWLNQQFVFADIQGNEVVATVKDFNDIAQLDYTYEEFEGLPAVCPDFPVMPHPVILAQAREFDILIPATPIRVNLRAGVLAVPPNKAAYLVFRNVRAESAPGVLYDVYLDLPQGAMPSRESPSYVATINFFGVTMMPGMVHDDGHGDRRVKMAAMKPRDFSFEVTNKLKSLRANGELIPMPSVTIVPQGEPNKEARPSIGQIQLAAQYNNDIINLNNHRGNRR